MDNIQTTKISKLPNMAGSFERLKIMLDLESRVKGNDLFSEAIRKSIADRKPHNEVIGWIKSQATDNPRIMNQVIGEDLTNRILNYQF